MKDELTPDFDTEFHVARRLTVDSTYRHYLRDLGYLIRQAAVESARAVPGDSFEQGRRMAYYEVASLMLSQAVSFGLPAEDLAMADLDPDRDLLARLA